MLNRKLKKAAMFGLDARIALAIFGALSVISGAALYSAIQQSKITATVVELQEVGKAVESYYLDIGFIPVDSSTGELSLWELIENSNNVKNWNGPYISKNKGGYFSRLAAPVGIGNFEITSAIYESADWGETDDATAGGPIICDDGDGCSVYIGLASVTNKAHADAIDVMIDGSVDNKKGRLRVFHTATPDYWVWYKIMPVQ